MASYLLLRDNKESGPYSLDDLVRLGLKPYDLVWVEGRSAAWRYPSEIAELEEFAPVVEEQPFDRFFKKQPGESVEELIAKRKKIEQERIEKEKKAQPEPAPFIESKKEKQPVKPKPIEKEKEKQKESEEIPYHSYQPRPNVFVSKPTTNSSRPANNFREEAQPQRQAASYSAYSAYSGITEEPVLEKKYSQSLDEIKEMYVNTLVQRKTRNRRKELVKKYLKPVLAAMFLVIAGIVIGYFVLNKKYSIEASQGISTVVPSQNQDQSSQQKNQVLNPDETTTTSAIINKKDPTASKQLLSQQKTPAINQQQSQVVNATVTPANTLAVQTPAETKIEKQDVEVDPLTNERSKVVRSDENANPEQPKESKPVVADNDTKDLRKLVSVNANEYLRGVFGGIRDLKITVNNRSGYMLDAVTVQVQYMKVTNQPLKTETITFKNVNPHDGETIKLPDSQRGMKVVYRITNIQSKQFQGTAGL